MIIQRITNEKIEHHNKENQWIVDFFKGEDVFIVGGGNSLRSFYQSGGFEKLKNKRVIAINFSYLYLDLPDILVFMDNTFNPLLMKQGHNLKDFQGKIITGFASGVMGKNIYHVHTTNKPTFNPGKMFSAHASGLIAINTALISNAKNIYLLGFDGQLSNGFCHFYDKEKTTNPEVALRYKRTLHHYKAFSEFKNIYNCSDVSLIKCFKYKTLDNILT